MATTRSKSGSAKLTNTRLKSSYSSNPSSEDANIDMISLSVVKSVFFVIISMAFEKVTLLLWLWLIYMIKFHQQSIVRTIRLVFF